MTPPNTVPGSAQDWLARSRGKLVLAKQPLPAGAYYEDLCNFAQQAAELAVKAVYQQNGWKFAFVHDLGLLLTGLAGHGVAVPDEIKRADDLTDYASELRYPSKQKPASAADHAEAIQIAEAVVDWAAAQIP